MGMPMALLLTKLTLYHGGFIQAVVCIIQEFCYFKGFWLEFNGCSCA